MTEPRRVGASLPELVAAYQADREAIDADLDAEERADQARRIEDQRAQRWRDVCPQRFHLATAEWVAAEHGLTVATTLANWRRSSPRPNLVLLGPVGTGKTGTALVTVAPDWFDRGLSIEFWPIVELLDGLRPDGGLEVDQLADVDRLIIDDLGSERPTDWTAERLYAVVNRRWLEERPTVVTSNLQPDDLAEAIGERLFSRLVGDDALIVHLAGRDRRRRTMRSV